MTDHEQSKGIVLKRIEPLSWWLGMNIPLQLMLYGEALAGSELTVEQPGVNIKQIHTADSPNYLFVDIEFTPEALAGEYTFRITKGDAVGTFTYQVNERRENAASRTSFTPADMIYLLMPDRFANGDPSNDNTPDTVEKSNRVEPFGRHGGDLQGIINHMDYLAALGVTALWITPPQLDDEAEQSYHGYACADYYRIDPRYGTNELYKELVEEAHRKGIKVIMDAVPNHCGTAHWWMADLPFHDWVHIHPAFTRSNYRLATISDPNSSKTDKHHTVNGWFDATMPDMALENPYVLQYFKQLYIWWVEWADLDGLRVDTFPYNDKEAIADWTKSILEEYPNLKIVAECWHSAAPIVAYWLSSVPNADGYNSYLPYVMDFPLQEAIGNSLSNDTPEWDKGMNTLYETMALDFVYGDARNLLLFLDNHDTERFADIVDGHPGKIKMGITLLATLRGIPQLYYGTEFGFRTEDSSTDHGGARRDFSGGWETDRKNFFSCHNCSAKEKSIYEHTKKLFNWRKTAQAVHEGKTIQFLPDDNTYSFVRYIDKQLVFVFINNTGDEFAVDWSRYRECIPAGLKGKNVLDDNIVVADEVLTVPAHTSVVIDFLKE